MIGGYGGAAPTIMVGSNLVTTRMNPLERGWLSRSHLLRVSTRIPVAWTKRAIVLRTSLTFPVYPSPARTQERSERRCRRETSSITPAETNLNSALPWLCATMARESSGAQECDVRFHRLRRKHNLRRTRRFRRYRRPATHRGARRQRPHHRRGCTACCLRSEYEAPRLPCLQGDNTLPSGLAGKMHAPSRTTGSAHRGLSANQVRLGTSHETGVLACRGRCAAALSNADELDGIPSRQRIWQPLRMPTPPVPRSSSTAPTFGQRQS